MYRRLGFILACGLASLACGGSEDDAAGAGGSSNSGGASSGGSAGSASGDSSGSASGGSSGATSGGSGGTGGSAQGAVTITGSGFGTKSTPGPVLFDDFENGSVGAKTESQAAVVGKWETGAGSGVPVYSDEEVRSGARASKHAFTKADYNASLSLNLDFSVGYLDYWTYVKPLDALPNGFSRNWKPFRLYGNSDALQSGTTTLNGNGSAIAYFIDSNNSISLTEWMGGYPSGWFHIQYWVRLNDVGSSNGVFQLRINNGMEGQTGAELRGDNAPLDQVRIGHYWATDGISGWPHDNSGANVYVDDVYFDTTWARVEVGDAATYAASTHREIQIVTAWSDTAVSFTPRRGTLPAGPAWAYVIGSDGNVLATQAVTLSP